ncbi:hypothetical protein [Actinomycetospora cinnamomea]|nr:hypothetical protein [Actinomycetospora cinnamomea]
MFASWRRAITAELCWIEPDGRPVALAVTPLVVDGLPVVALPYAHAPVVSGLRAAEQAAFVVSDSRSLRRDETGRAAIGRVEVTDDTDGGLLVDEVLGQELRKYPPSRSLVDSPLLRRENWWWLPRIVVRLDPATAEEVAVPRRTNPRAHRLLVRDAGDRPGIDVVEVRGGGERLSLTGLAGERLRGDGAGATVFGYDYSQPDLERWESWSVHGTLFGDELVVSGREGDPERDLGPLPLLRRLSRHRELSRGCRRGIAAAERARHR